MYCPEKKPPRACEEGYFCPVLSSEPIKCDWWGVCPEKTAFQNSIGWVCILNGPSMLVWVIALFTTHRWLFDKRQLNIGLCWLGFAIAILIQARNGNSVHFLQWFIVIEGIVLVYGVHVSGRIELKYWRSTTDNVLLVFLFALPPVMVSYFGALHHVPATTHVSRIADADLSDIAIYALAGTLCVAVLGVQELLDPQSPFSLNAKVALMVVLHVLLGLEFLFVLGGKGAYASGRVGQNLSYVCFALPLLWSLQVLLSWFSCRGNPLSPMSDIENPERMVDDEIELPPIRKKSFAEKKSFMLRRQSACGGVSRLKQEFGPGPYVGILSGQSYENTDTEEFVDAIAKALVATSNQRMTIITDGTQAAPQVSFAKGCKDGWLRVLHLTPAAQKSDFDFGINVTAGANSDECKSIFEELGDIYITVGGGPNVAEQAQEAFERGATVVPLVRTGGASSGLFGFPPAVLKKPDFIGEEDWERVISKDIPIAEAAASVATIITKLTPPELAGVDFQLEGVDFALRSGKTIVHNISLYVAAGECVGILGSSGSGKSTLLNVMSGRCGYGEIQRGEVLIAGMPAMEARAKLAGRTGFVPQDDVLHRILTVEENINYQAKLRIPFNARSDDRTGEVMRALGISHVANTAVGDENVRGISGGQRKRVSVGMEFIADPVVLFLDEPTSGLDSATAHQVMQVVCDESRRKGMTSAAVIHSPRWATLMLFDTVILMASGGYCVYAGPAKRLKSYFAAEVHIKFPEDVNPADTILDAITFETACEMVESGDLDKDSFAADLGSGDSFGRSLAKLWLKVGSPMFAVPDAAKRINAAQAKNMLKTTGQSIHWSQARVAHLDRSFLLLYRIRFRVVIFVLLTMVAGTAPFLAFGFHPLDLGMGFVNGAQLSILGGILVQGIAGLQALSGEEIAVARREGAAGLNMGYWFLSKQLVNLLEIFPAGVAWSALVWRLSGTTASLWDISLLGFSMFYCQWGLAYLWSVLVEPATAQILVVLSTFVLQLSSGMAPDLSTFVGDKGDPNKMLIFLPLVSPQRWAMGHFFHLHFSSDGYPKVNLRNVIGSAENQIPGGIRFSSECPRQASLLRWIDGNGMVCSAWPLIFLGIVFRMVVQIILMVQANVHTNGGYFECRGRLHCQNSFVGSFVKKAIDCLGLQIKLFIFLMFLFAVFLIGHIQYLY
jgi:ABC-type multidrug transport system ATPase subunit